MASYFAYELISVFPPHVSVGSDIHSPRLKRSQQSGVWWNKESCSFSMSQQAAHKLCTQTQRHRDAVRICSLCAQSAYFLKVCTLTLVRFFFYFLGLKRVKWLLCVCESANLKCSLCHICSTVKSFFDPLFMSVSELPYLFSDGLFGIEAWQMKYSTSMVKGAGIAVWFVIDNCFVTALFMMTSSPKSSNSVEGLSSSGAGLKTKN